jgi:hypothetical protein
MEYSSKRIVGEQRAEKSTERFSSVLALNG